MKKHLILLFVLCTFFLYAEDDDFIVEPNSLDDPSFSLSNLEGEPSATVHNCVNALTGGISHFSNGPRSSWNGATDFTKVL